MNTIEDIVAKHDAQLGGLMGMLSRIEKTTKATHRVVVAASIIGPPHRATLGLGLLSLTLSIIALGVSVGACAR